MKKKPSRLRTIVVVSMLMLLLADAASPGYGKSNFWFMFVPFQKAYLAAQGIETATGIPVVSFPKSKVEEMGDIRQLVSRSVQQAPKLLDVPQERKTAAGACQPYGLPYLYLGFSKAQWEKAEAQGIKGRSLNSLQLTLGAFYCILKPEAVAEQMRSQVSDGTVLAVRFLPSSQMKSNKVLDVYVQNHNEPSQQIAIGFQMREPALVDAAPPVAAPVAPPAAAPEPGVTPSSV